MSDKIREKTMRAWGDQAAVRVETTFVSYGGPFEGIVVVLDMEGIVLKYPTTNAGRDFGRSRRELHWVNITDIVFLDESEPDEPESDSQMIIDLKDALLDGYRVKITFGRRLDPTAGSDRTGVVTGIQKNTFAFREDGDDRDCSWHFASVLSVERIDVQDVAKERWEVVDLPNGRRQICLRGESGRVLFEQSSPCTLAVQVYAAAAASEMLERMEESIDMLESQQSWRNHPSLIGPIKRCKAVIEKARGE